MAKTKLRWIFPPAQDLQTIEVKDINNIGVSGVITRVRKSIYFYDEQDNLCKVLYSTDGGDSHTEQPRFYRLKKDEWSMLTPATNRVRRGYAGRCAKGGGGFDTPYFGDPYHIQCHRMVAYAWCKHPEEAEKDPLWYKYGHGFECDHKNCDHNDCCPKNLEWLTTEANHTRYHKRQKPLIALYGKTFIRLISYDNLDRIFALTDAQFALFVSRLPAHFAGDTSELSAEAINRDIEEVLYDIPRNDSSAT